LKHYALIEEPDSEAISSLGAQHIQAGRISYRETGKRILDFTLAALAVPPTLVIVLLIAVVMVVSGDRGPIFFGHKRIGKNGKTFRCWKIRSMVTDAEKKLRAHLDANPEAAAEWERDHKLENDPRITRFGAFLRATSLDELPNVWNVLKGDLSLVGPRPIVRAEVRKYGCNKRDYFSVRPGVTGLWQISGRNDITYRQRVLLDVEYIQNISMKLDLKVILATVGAVLNRTGK